MAFRGLSEGLNRNKNSGNKNSIFNNEDSDSETERRPFGLTNNNNNANNDYNTKEGTFSYYFILFLHSLLHIYKILLLVYEFT